MVRVAVVVTACIASVTSAYERPELYSVDEFGVKHCTGMCRSAAPFDTLMPGVMHLKEKLDNDCASRGVCTRDDLPSSSVGANCTAGFATLSDGSKYGCSEIDLYSFVNNHDLGVSRDPSTGRYWRLNDIWGWVDPVTGAEWAIVGAMDGTSFVDVTDPVHPVVVAWLPTFEGTEPRAWRDIKVFKDHAFIVEDNSPHGLQIVDMVGLRELRADHFRRCESTSYGAQFPGITDDWCATNCADGEGALAAACDPETESHLCECKAGYETIKEDVHYFEFEDCHNLFITQETGTLYCGGSSTCGAGPHMVDVNDPKNPKFLGCYGDDGYTHDLQCVMYNGPDSRYQGKEICALFNEDTLTLGDFDDKENVKQLGRESYYGFAYSHQGWFTEDHRFILLDDEIDEVVFQDPNSSSPTVGVYVPPRWGELTINGTEFPHSYRGRASGVFTVLSTGGDEDITIENQGVSFVANGGCDENDWTGPGSTFLSGTVVLLERGDSATGANRCGGNSNADINAKVELAAKYGATGVMISNVLDNLYPSFEVGITTNIDDQGLIVIALTNQLGEELRAGMHDASVTITVKALEIRTETHGRTITHVWNVEDLENIRKVGEFISEEEASDHNQYVHGHYVVQSNYCAGLRILDIQNIDKMEEGAQLEEVAWFDVEPSCDYASFDGTWSNYLFPSGKLVVTSKDRGLFTMQPRIEGLTGHIK